MHLPLAASDDVFKLIAQIAALFFFIVLPILQRSREKKAGRRDVRAPRKPAPRGPAGAEPEGEWQNAQDMWRKLLEGDEPADARRAPGAPHAGSPDSTAPPGSLGPTGQESLLEEFVDAPLEVVPDSWTPVPEELEAAPGSVFTRSDLKLPSELAPIEAMVALPDSVSTSMGGASEGEVAQELGALAAAMQGTAPAYGASRASTGGARALLGDLRRPADWRRAVVLAEVLGPPRSLSRAGEGGFGAPPGLA